MGDDEALRRGHGAPVPPVCGLVQEGRRRPPNSTRLVARKPQWKSDEELRRQVQEQTCQTVTMMQQLSNLQRTLGTDIQDALADSPATGLSKLLV